MSTKVLLFPETEHALRTSVEIIADMRGLIAAATNERQLFYLTTVIEREVPKELRQALRMAVVARLDQVAA